MSNLRAFVIYLCVFLSSPLIFAEPFPVMPYPMKVSLEEGARIGLTAGFSVEFTQDSVVTERLQRAAARTERRYFRQTGLPHVSSLPTLQRSRLMVHVQQPSQLPFEALDDEAYTLSLKNDGLVLSATSEFGALRGLETFLQLIEVNAGQYSLPSVSIQDAPQFLWRGLMLDSSRHFIEADTIKRLLHVMASAKLNVFHWHLVDDQGWRLPIDGYPALHEKASDNQFYSHDQVREIVALADQLGIRVVPELDFPGHASAIAVAYPNLMSRVDDYQMERSWGVHRPLLDPTKDEVYAFIAAGIEQLARLFPDPYVHIGGDEVEPHDWLNTPHIADFMLEMNFTDGPALQAYFNQRVNQILIEHKKTMIGWDEVAHPGLPKNVMIQSWRGYDSLAESARNQRPVILSTGFYVDQPQYTSYHWDNQILPSTIPDIDVTDSKHLSFEIKRLRGSSIRGTLTIAGQGSQAQGFIDFAGRSRQMLEVLDATDTYIRGRVNTWMGPTEFRFSLSEQSVQGYAVVGNASLVVSGSIVEAIEHNEGLPKLSSEQNSYIKGAEATIWSEIVTDNLLDLRLWPRMYAVAEQMWGTADKTSATEMYSRLRSMDVWSRLSVGSQQHEQHELALFRSFGTNVSVAEKRIATLLEPAHYYHRHHIKSKNDRYTVFEPLNRLVDALPVESIAVIEFNTILERWFKSRSEEDSKALQLTLEDWDFYIERGKQLSNEKLSQHIERLEKQRRIIHSLLEKSRKKQLLSAREIADLQETIQQMRTPQDEIIAALILPVETLFFHLLNQLPDVSESLSSSFKEKG